MNEIVGIIVGVIGIVIGSWLLNASIKNKLPQAMQIWWLPKDYAGRESLGRLMGMIVGAVFVITGFLIFILPLSTLLQ